MAPIDPEQPEDDESPEVLRSQAIVLEQEIADLGGGQVVRTGIGRVISRPQMEDMKAGIDLIQEVGLPAISAQLLKLKARLHAGLQPLGFTFLGPDPRAINASCITTVQHPQRSLADISEHLTAHNITTSLRHNRAGQPLLRFSPHFYNTEAEMDRVAKVIAEVP